MPQDAPNAPSVPPPVSSKAKDYSMERPREVQNELDELRNQGLAKVLNRHFTDTTKKLAKEKAAADAALADLERRRANTSKFVPSKGGDLNPFDAIYVELQQKRAECRRKERETMLLYQRYVHKFGKAAAKPIDVRTPPTDSSITTAEESGKSSAISTPESPPPPPFPISLRQTLEPLDENSEAETLHTSMKLSRFHNEHMCGRRRIDPPPKVSLLEPEIPELEDLTEQPSHDEQSGVVSSNDPPEHQILRRDDALDSSLLVIGRDTKNSLGISKKADPPTNPQFSLLCLEDSEISTPKTPNTPSVPSMHNSEPVEPAMEIGWGGTQFLSVDKTEGSPTSEEKIAPAEATIKMAPERTEIGSDASDSNRPAREVPAAPTKNAGDDCDDRSVISGLTIGSQVTKQVMVEIEQEMTNFLDTETKAIQEMLDEEEDRTLESAALNGSASILGDLTHHASAKAEAMALEMQKILDEYKKEESSLQNKAVDDTDGNTEATVGYPKEYPNSDPTKHWMVYYDEDFKREYYYEKISKKTQWTPPEGGKSTEIDVNVFSEAVSPRGGTKRGVSRRGLYRQKIRKRRMRRLAISFIAVIFAAITVFHWQQNSGRSYKQVIFKSWSETSAAVGDGIDSALYAIADKAELIKDSLEYKFTNRRQLEEFEASRLETELRARQLAEERERKSKELEARRLREQKEEAIARRQKEENEKQEHLLKMTLQREAGLKAQREREEALKRSHEDELLQKQKAVKYPVACFLPLAVHFHPRCQKFAKLRPLFKDTDVLNSFLQ